MMDSLSRRLSAGGGAPSLPSMPAGLPSLPSGVMDLSSGFSLLQKACVSKVQRCSSMVIFPSSQKTIPFTVPAAASGSATPPPRVAARGLVDDSGSIGTASGGSEPASPSSSSASGGGGLVRGSFESLGTSAPAGSSLDFRGAYSLGTIDPSLYRGHSSADDAYDLPPNHLGRVWFSVEYERETEKLLVTVIKARNLPSRSLSSTNQCDPFVRIYLMPDERRYLQSKFKKKTVNPTFDESFVFQVSNKSISERLLRVTVYDVDRHRRHAVVGHALYPLRDHNHDSNERVVIWRDLERQITESTNEKGDVNVSLCYNNHLERLTVGVFEGKNFLNLSSNSPPDYYMKVCLMHQNKVLKTKKTEVCRRSVACSPVFNESFTFKLSAASLDTSSVSVTAMQHSTAGARDKVLGRVVFGSFMFARGKELELWNEMVANSRESVSGWFQIT